MSSIKSKIIYETKDYSLFKLTNRNREIRSENIRKLTKSMQAEEMGSIFPIVVDKNYKIIDGQHRFTARKELGLPIYYLISPVAYNPKNVILANKNTFKWRISDYMELLAKEGDANCAKALKEATNYGVPINIFLSTLGIDISDEILGNGKFKYTSTQTKQAEELFYELSIFKKYKFWNQMRFIKAYKKLRGLNNYQFEKMVDALDKHAEMLTPQTSRVNYFFKLMEVYNYNRKKLNRVFYDAQEAFEDWRDA